MTALFHPNATSNAAVSAFGPRRAWVASACRIVIFAIALTHLPAFGERAPLQSGTSMASSSFSVSGPQASLDQAIAADDAGAIAQALSAGAQVNARGPKDVTPLMVAVDRQKLRAVQALLQAGADTKPVAIDGASAVSLAVENYKAQPAGDAIMQALFKAGADPNTIRPNGDPVIMKFVRAHDCDALRLMKSFGANLDIRDRTDDPIITKAAVAMNWDVVWCLMELGARFDYENGGASDPLSLSLANKAPSRSSPIFQYKEKVWQRLHDKGIALKPLVG